MPDSGFTVTAVSPLDIVAILCGVTAVELEFILIAKSFSKSRPALGRSGSTSSVANVGQLESNTFVAPFQDFNLMVDLHLEFP